MAKSHRFSLLFNDLTIPFLRFYIGSPFALISLSQFFGDGYGYQF